MILERKFRVEVPPRWEFKTNDEIFINSKTVIEKEPFTLPKIKVKFETRKKEIKSLKLNKIPLGSIN